MVAAAVGTYAPRYDYSFLAVSTVLALQAGIMLWLLRLSQMGGLVNLLSHPVMTGFVNAAAVLIVASQLPALTGISSAEAPGFYPQIVHLATHLERVNPAVVTMAVASLGGLWLVRNCAVPLLRLFTRNVADEHPIRRTGPMLVTVAAAATVAAWHLDVRFAVPVVGTIPPGLPGLTLPPFDWRMWVDVAPAAAMIAVVSYVGSYSIGATLATRQRTRINSHQELIALGAANIGAAFTGAFPVGGSFSRSSVQYQAGARSQMSAVVCVGLIVLTLLFASHLFQSVPRATLAAIVVVSVAGIIDVHSMRRHWRIHREDSITEVATLLTVLAFGIEAGLITGVALSIAFFVRTSSRPHIVLVGRIPHTGHFRSAQRHDVETFPHVAAMRIDENIYFGNANQVENKLLKIVQRRPGTRHVLLVMSSVNMIDVSGLEMLYRLNGSLDAMGIALHMSDVKGPVMEQLEASDFVLHLTGSVFFSTDQGMRDLAERA